MEGWTISNTCNATKAMHQRVAYPFEGRDQAPRMWARRYSMAPPGKLASVLQVSPGLQPNGCRITSPPGRKQKSALDAQDNQTGDPQLQPKEVTRGHLLSQQMPRKVHPTALDCTTTMRFTQPNQRPWSPERARH